MGARRNTGSKAGGNVGGRPSSKSVSVHVGQAKVPDAPERLRRAFDLILHAAARAEEAATQDSRLPQERKPEEAGNE